MAPCFPMSSQSRWYASKDHKEWWWHTSFQNFQKGENRNILIKMLRTIYYLANKNLSHEMKKTKIWRIWLPFFQPFFSWSGNIIPRFLNGWEPSQIHRFWCTAWFFYLGIRTWVSCPASPFTFLCPFSPLAFDSLVEHTFLPAEALCSHCIYNSEWSCWHFVILSNFTQCSSARCLLTSACVVHIDRTSTH